MTREEFLDARVGKLQEYVLSLRCYDGCERPGTVSLQLLAASYGHQLQLRAVLRQLRCSACRRAPAHVAIAGAQARMRALPRGGSSSCPDADWARAERAADLRPPQKQAKLGASRVGSTPRCAECS